MLVETRGNDGKRAINSGFYEALLNPNASFNGLWSLKNIPQIDINKIIGLNYNDLARYIFKLLGADTRLLDEALRTYQTFDNKEIPLLYQQIESNLHIQKLYTGPTRAFKDMAMQPFGSMLCSLAKESNQNYLILSATSGDTGPATLEAIKDKPNIYGICMYPHNGTSDVQRLQMTTLDSKNIKVLAIEGNFDDTQNVLKTLLNNNSFKEKLENLGFRISATNSVNFGRIIFQIIYHIHSYIHLLQNGLDRQGSFNIIVPSGNFGNALGAFFAKKMGIKINKIIIATNANCVLYELIKYGIYNIENRALIKTNSPAMDILKSSNVERVLFHLFGANRTKELMEELDKHKKYKLNANELQILQSYFDATKCDDSEVLEIIKKYANKNIIIDPHTATGICGFRKISNTAESSNFAQVSNLKEDFTHKENSNFTADSVRDSNFAKNYNLPESTNLTKDSNDKIPTILCSTAEWSKFAPTIAKALNKNLNDKEALDFISKEFSLPLHQNIKNLFNLNEINNKILAKGEVKEFVESYLEETIKSGR